MRYGKDRVRGSPGGLLLIRQLVASGLWTASAKVREFLDRSDYTDEDLECCVANGRVHKRERDEYREAVDGSVYVIRGRAVAGHEFYAVGKILRDEEGLYFRFITAHRAE